MVGQTQESNEGQTEAQPRHVTWFDQPEHTATDPPLQDTPSIPRPQSAKRKRLSSALAFPEYAPVENVLIMRTPVQQEEQLSMRTLANESLSKRYPVTEMTTEHGQMGDLVEEDTSEHSDKIPLPHPVIY